MLPDHVSCGHCGSGTDSGILGHRTSESHVSISVTEGSPQISEFSFEIACAAASSSGSTMQLQYSVTFTQTANFFAAAPIQEHHHVLSRSYQAVLLACLPN